MHRLAKKMHRMVKIIIDSTKLAIENQRNTVKKPCIAGLFYCV